MTASQDLGFFKLFSIRNQRRDTLANGEQIHALLGSNGKTFMANVNRGGWAVGDHELFEDLSQRGIQKLLNEYPELNEPLVDQKWERKTYQGINPWTLKVADFCNLGCSYCYEDAQPQAKRMTRETADRIITEMVGTRQKNITVLFHGGEPTLNMELIRYFVVNLREKAQDRFEAKFLIHTNLYSFSDSLKKELADLGVLVSSSLDGQKAVNDQQRLTVGKRSAYDSVVKNLKKMDRKYLITTVTKHNEDKLLEAATHFVEDLGVYRFHFLPLLPHGRPKVQELIPSSRKMADSMLEVFDYALKKWNEGLGVSIRNLDDIIMSLHSGMSVNACQKCVLGEFKSQSITINHDGTFAPCDAAAGYEEYALGNIHECNSDLLKRMESERNFRVFKSLDKVEGCNVCPYKYSCGGGCEERDDQNLKNPEYLL